MSYKKKWKNRVDAKKKLLQFNTSLGTFTKDKTQEFNDDPKAIIYCRVSDVSQLEGSGLESQERVCRERCERQRPPIIVDKVFIEPGVSGAETNRKGLNDAFAYLKTQNKGMNRITHFVVSEASRISRPENIGEAFAIEAQIKSHGVDIVKVDSPGLDDSTDVGILFKTIQYAFSGYERKQIVRRANNGRKNRMKDGYWPFAVVPVGYIRKRLSKKDYIDIIDPVKGSIIQEGLNLFANDILITQSDLWKFRDSKGLRTNDKRSKKLRRTFPEKALQLHRLFFYAGYVLYPDRGIEKPIQGQHEGLITLSTANKIVEKLQKVNRSHNKFKINKEKMSDLHPLRGLITCPFCKRKFTSRITKKYKTKGGVKTCKEYPYYGCANNSCEGRVYVPKKELEEQFSDVLESMTIPMSLDKAINFALTYTVEQRKGTKNQYKQNLKKLITSIEQRMTQLEENLSRTRNLDLFNKLEDERSQLSGEKNILEDKLKNIDAFTDNTNILFNKTKLIFGNPVELWKYGGSAMRQLLIRVRFGDVIYYTKKDGLRTKESGTLYGIFKELRTECTVKCPAGFKLRTRIIPFMGRLSDLVCTKQEAIASVWTHVVYKKLGHINEEGQYCLTLPSG